MTWCVSGRRRHDHGRDGDQADGASLVQSHVICTPQAGAVIKTYSPNLMVHPLMRQTPPLPSSSQNPGHGGDAEHDAAGIIDMLPRLHVLVVGPGLGRDPRMLDTVARVVRAARDRDMAVVLDADALQLVQRDPDLVRGYVGAVLTPNVVEFGRLWDSLGLGERKQHGETDKVEAMARALGGVTVIQKGKADLISNGESTLIDDLEGGRKRSGGQGDTLTGSVATFLGWRKAYLDGIWDSGDSRLSAAEMMGLAAFGGSAITRVSRPATPPSTAHNAFHRTDEPRTGRECTQNADASWCAGSLSTGLCQKGPEPTGERPDRRGSHCLHWSLWGS